MLTKSLNSVKRLSYLRLGVTPHYVYTMKARVVVMPKEAVLDPQGAAVRDAMKHLGMPEVRSVRIGKYLEIDLEEEEGDLEKGLFGFSRVLFSNRVMKNNERQKGKA